MSKLTPEQWAEARRLRAGGATFKAIAAKLGISDTSVSNRARREGWDAPPGIKGASRNGPPAVSPATAGIRSRLALRLYRVIECKIKMLELRMMRELDAHERASADGTPPPPIKDERDSFAALIASINQVTEMVSEPAFAADGRRGTARGSVNPELTALSADLEPDGLAVASEKDQFRRELATHLGKMFPDP